MSENLKGSRANPQLARKALENLINDCREIDIDILSIMADRLRVSGYTVSKKETQ